MGFPYHELITPAILLDNPGLSKAQLEHKLQQTHFSTDEVAVGAPFDTGEEGFTPEDLPKILNLSYSETFRDFQATSKDSNGLDIYGPRMEVVFGNDDPANYWRVDGYKVVRQTGNNLGPQVIIRRFDYGSPVPGKVVGVAHEQEGWREYLVNDFVENKLLGQKITPVMEEQVFPSLEKLYESWPEFKPSNMYDFFATNGNFGFIIGGANFLWKKVDGKYYLDEKTFEKISAGFFHENLFKFGYVDLILTAEAIRQKAWKLLSRRGLTHLDDFLTQFPQSKVRYEQAIWDSHTSLAAKRKGMTNTEFLRMRLFPPAVFEDE